MRQARYTGLNQLTSAALKTAFAPGHCNKTHLFDSRRCLGLLPYDSACLAIGPVVKLDFAPRDCASPKPTTAFKEDRD